MGITTTLACTAENLANERATSTTASTFGSPRVCVRNSARSEITIDFRFHNQLAVTIANRDHAHRGKARSSPRVIRASRIRRALCHESADGERDQGEDEQYIIEIIVQGVKGLTRGDAGVKQVQTMSDEMNRRFDPC